MSETMTQRVARLISGSVNALVDAVENMAPDAVMNQAIREVDSAIADTRAELGRQVAQKHLSSKKLIEENNRYETLAEQLQVAVANNRDDLAEVGIAEQIDIEARIPILENSIAETAAREKELEGFILALQAKKREMQAELNAFTQARKTVPNTENSTPDKAAMQAERAGAAFNRTLQKASGVVGRDIDLGKASQLAELEDLSRKNRVAERLAAIKAGQS